METEPAGDWLEPTRFTLRWDPAALSDDVTLHADVPQSNVQRVDVQLWVYSSSDSQVPQTQISNCSSLNFSRVFNPAQPT